jgi:hypothetical protein
MVMITTHKEICLKLALLAGEQEQRGTSPLLLHESKSTTRLCNSFAV